MPEVNKSGPGAYKYINAAGFMDINRSRSMQKLAGGIHQFDEKIIRRTVPFDKPGFNIVKV
jgi:hypothetical protein